MLPLSPARTAGAQPAPARGGTGLPDDCRIAPTAAVVVTVGGVSKRKKPNHCACGLRLAAATRLDGLARLRPIRAVALVELSEARSELAVRRCEAGTPLLDLPALRHRF